MRLRPNSFNPFVRRRASTVARRDINALYHPDTALPAVMHFVGGCSRALLSFESADESLVTCKACRRSIALARTVVRF